MIRPVRRAVIRFSPPDREVVESVHPKGVLAMTETTDLRGRREAIVKEHVTAENDHNPAAVVATFHTPRYDVPAMGPAGQAQGAQAVEDLIGSLFVGFPDWYAEPGPLCHADDAVFVEVRMTGTHDGEFAGIPPTGRPIDVRVGCIFEFDEDRLLCEKVYFDFATILMQLGVLPAPESAPAA
jgi:steroid delta-isomerase-like uncharacterized protein